MSDIFDPTRRNILAYAGAMGVAIASPAATAATSGARKTFDPADPLENAYGYAKMQGDLDGKVEYFLSVGYIIGFMPGQLPQILTGFQNIKANKVTDSGDGSYVDTYSSFYVFTDPEKPELLKTWTNPYTGVVNEPFHYRSGPSKTYITPRGLKGTSGKDKPSGTPDPLIFPWTTMGDQMLLPSNFSSYFPSDLDPDEWPMESPGKQMISTHFGNRICSLADLENRDLRAMNVIAFSNAHTNWLPWMAMGKMPGHIAFNVVGSKFESLDAVPKETVNMVHQVRPGFFDAPFDLPYTLQFREYKKFRKPIDPGQSNSVS